MEVGLENKCKFFEKEYNVSCYLDAQKMLKDKRPDIVVICTREKQRYSLAMITANMGIKAIVLEKPIAANIDQAPKVDWVMGQVANLEEGLETVHPAPAFVVGYLSFKNGVRAVLKCGRRFSPAVGFDEGELDSTWMQKRVQVLGIKGIADTIVTHSCRIMNEEGGWKILVSAPSGWNNATINYYHELKVLREGGNHRNNGSIPLQGFESIHGIYQFAVTLNRVEIPISSGVDSLKEIMKKVKR